MEVNHRRFDIAMPKQLFDGMDINSGIEQMGGETMAQGMYLVSLLR